MRVPGLPVVKVCCIASVKEARLAIDSGASAIGLVSAMPSGPGPIAEERIAEIARAIPPPIATFLLTCCQDVQGIVEQHVRCRTNTIQLVDRMSIDDLVALRARLPGIHLVQVIHVVGPESVTEALEAAPFVDALLLDSGNPAAKVKELGGTGRVHEWRYSREIRDRSPAPLFLAGGLNASNVAAAVETVRPFGVDLCSGVRTNGALDGDKLHAFFGALGRSALSSDGARQSD